MSEMDLHRVQVMRQQCSRIFKGKSVHDIVGTLQALTADMLTFHMAASEQVALSGARAIAADVENIIRERFSTQGKGH